MISARLAKIVRGTARRAGAVMFPPLVWCTARAWYVALCGVLLLTAWACTPPIRQYDIKNQKLTCDEANDYSFRSLQAMGFTMTHFEPATAAHAGTIHATREERGKQNVTVVVTCGSGSADIDASEDGRLLGQLEFKRGFYLSFTAVAAQTAVIKDAARREAERPLEEKREKGLHVLLKPVRGLAAKLDFGLDLAAAGVLPVRIAINNATVRTYDFDPDDIVLIDKEGTRVHPMSIADAAQGVVNMPQDKDAEAGAAAPVSTADVTQRLRAKLLTSHSVSSNQRIDGYLFFPLASYVKARVLLEDRKNEETEGFVVEF